MARLSWLAGRLAVAAVVLVGAGAVTGLLTSVGAASTDAGVRVVAVLAGIFVLGIGTLLHGLAPRLAVPSPTAWWRGRAASRSSVPASASAAGYWTPRCCTHLARAAAVPVRWDRAAILVAIGLAAATGAIAFARRDLKGA